MPVSAAVRSMPPLPAGQASLAMLLVDVPHLAGVAEEAGALQWITDPRLAPIARAVVDGAHQGIDRTMPDLLALVDPAAQSLVHDTVFAGRYRDLSDQDPQALLHALVHRCHEHALDAEIHELDRQIKALEQQGLPAEASELAQRRLDVRRRQAALRAQALD